VSSGDGMDTGLVLIVPRSEGEAATRINEDEEAARATRSRERRSREDSVAAGTESPSKEGCACGPFDSS
jgi:hypothetical protein